VVAVAVETHLDKGQEAGEQGEERGVCRVATVWFHSGKELISNYAGIRLKVVYLI
jgi:hypothetical protein